MTNLKTKTTEFKKLVDTREEANHLMWTFIGAKIKARYRKTPNGKYIITFFI